MENKKELRQEKREQKIRHKALENQRNRIYNEMVKEEKKHRKEKKISPSNVYISLQNINKIYPNKVQAVYNFNLDIKKNEFIVFVGPSGCGKSTTLRMIAGLEDITAGDLYIDGVYANDLEPKNRDIAMVFQSYALYPQMSVYGNMSFGLKIRKVPTVIKDKDGVDRMEIAKGLIGDKKKELKNLLSYKEECIQNGMEEKANLYNKYISELEEEIKYLENNEVPMIRNRKIPKSDINDRVLKAARILQINEYLERKPKALSGGQCQRVALGRAIVRNAKVFLMDEPLSNLDAKLRVQMRSEIVKLHNSLNATTIYVTHDQTEAMSMASRIVVMNKGYVQQIGTPVEIYNHPSNIFVATFIGSPAMNIQDVTFSKNKVTFKNDSTLKISAAQSKLIKEFIDNELDSYNKELIQIDEGFVERNAILEKITNVKEDASKDEAKKTNEVEELTSQLRQIEESNERRKYLVKAIASYQESIKNKNYDLVFGVRPEDVYETGSNVHEDIKLSESFKMQVSVAELMGHEYFIHSDFSGKDFVSKVSARRIVAPNDIVEFSFDMGRIHIFDKVSQKAII